ncbi:hemolysin XhlA family protein [Paenibacillus ferrarius]|uniref:hemolysin XhlA family protein n=1 Tax=Paenibacillus ferrarius TaxID=1469647 RepID=UPI003D27C228
MPDETNEILQRLTRVETKLDLMINARDIAQEALQSTKAAHHRLDRIDKIVFWAGTTAIGAIIVGAVALLFKFRGA